MKNDIIERAAKTWVQAFFAALAAGVLNVTNMPSAKALLIGALAAGFSAAMNAVLSLRA